MLYYLTQVDQEITSLPVDAPLCVFPGKVFCQAEICPGFKSSGVTFGYIGTNISPKIVDSQLASRNTWLALSLLAIAYTLLGWYLAAHHVFWLISTVVVATTLFFAWKSNPVLESLTWLIKQPVVIIIGITFIFSLVVAITLAQPIFFSLMSLPLMTLLYALLEMRAAEFTQSKIFFWSVVIAGLGLGLGEAIDLLIAPSMRY